MTETAPAPRRGTLPLNEDWLATLVGLAIVLIVGAGLLGPGAQNVTLQTASFESVSQDVRAMDGWQASATLDGERVSIADAPTTFEAGNFYLFTCMQGALSAVRADAPPEGMASPPPGYATIVLSNGCQAGVSLSLRTNPIIPWPVFRVF
jgi:hypothetical protein